jgi:hypothetical protein
VPESLPGARHVGFKYEASQEQLLIRTFWIAKVLISNGEEMRIQPRPAAAEGAIRTLLMGWAMGALLHQRRCAALQRYPDGAYPPDVLDPPDAPYLPGAIYPPGALYPPLPLHASAVTDHDGALVICARRGGGKSTLAAALLQRGYRLLDDDLAAVAPTAQGLLVHPGSHEMRLWAPALDAWPGHPPVTRQVRPDIPKFTLDGRAYYHNQPAPLRKIYVLERGPQQSVEFRPLNGAEKLRQWARHTYCYHFLQAMGCEANYFIALLNLADQVPLTHITLPQDFVEYDKLAEMIAK